MSKVTNLVRRPAAVDSGAALLASLGSLGLAFLGGVIVAREFGPQGKGIVSVSYVLVSQAAILGLLGIDIAVVYFVGRRNTDPQVAAGAGTGLAVALAPLAFALAAIGLFVVLRDRFPSSSQGYVLLFMVAVVPTMVNGVMLNVNRACGRIVEASVVTLGVAAALLVATVAGSILLGSTQAVLVLRLVVLCLATLMILLVSASKWGTVGRNSKIYAPRLQLSMVGYGMRGYIGTAFQSFNYRLDAILVASLLSIRSAGIYSVAVSLAEILWIVPNVLGVVLLQRAAVRPDAEATRITSLASRLTALLLLVAIVAWAVAARFLVEVPFGVAFRDATGALLALLPGIWALALWKNFANDLSGRGYPGAKSISAGCAVVATVILDLLLIPKLGIVGAGVASSVAYSITLIVMLFYYVHVTGASVASLLIPRRGDLGTLREALRRARSYLVTRPQGKSPTGAG